VEQIRCSVHIDNMNRDWIKEQFNEEASQHEIIIDDPYTVTKKEVIYAMYKIGKNKAPSYDGLLDIIFQKQMYKHILIGGFRPT